MSSSSRCCATGVFVLPSLLLLPLFLSLVCGATLREHRLSGAEPVTYGTASQIRPPPSAEMIRALRYIQSLSQRTPPDPLPDEGQPEQEAEDMEGVRSMLQMAAPARMDRGMEESEDEKDKTQELLQAVLTTLKQTEEHMVPQKTPQKVIATPRYAVPSFSRPKQQLEVQPLRENYGRNSWANSDNRRQHRKFPLMFEDEDDQPLKRTNENAEEQYTPQKLATLQSVFEELSGITASKANNKRDDDEDDEDEEDNDLYRQRKMILEDIMGTDDWTPLEESEEEQRERHEFNRNFEDDEDQEEEDEEDDSEVKRSSQSDWLKTRKEEEPEDMAKLVDYYLLQILEKKEQEQQKRQALEEEAEKKDADEDEDDEDEKEDEKRGIKPMHSTFPESLSQVLKISQKLQIPPEEVLELLQNEKRKNSPSIPTQSRISYTNPRKTFATSPHQRPLDTSDNSIAQDILSILEMVSAAQQYRKQPTQPKTPRYYQRETGRDDYDDTAGEDDELANYLASQMFTQGQRHARLTPSQDHAQSMYGNLERTVQDYFKKSAQEKRPAEHENTDNNTMLKILRYLDPENDDADETDSEGKTVPEM